MSLAKAQSTQSSVYLKEILIFNTLRSWRALGEITLKFRYKNIILNYIKTICVIFLNLCNLPAGRQVCVYKKHLPSPLYVVTSSTILPSDTNNNLSNRSQSSPALLCLINTGSPKDSFSFPV